MHMVFLSFQWTEAIDNSMFTPPHILPSDQFKADIPADSFIKAEMVSEQQCFEL